MGSSRTLVAIVSTCALASAVAAQPKPTDAQKQQAGELVKQAIAKSQAGDHQAAIELYMNAYELIPMAVLLSNIGTEYQQAKKRVEALKYFCRYLEKDPTGPNVTYATAQAKVISIELGNKDVDDATVCKPKVETGAGSGSAAGTGAGTGTGTASGTGTGTVTGTAIGKTDDGATAKPSRGLQYAGAGVAVAGAVAFGLGIYYGIHAKNISDFISTNTSQWPDTIHAMEADGKQSQTNAIIFDIIGPAAMIAGGAMFVLGRPKARDRVTVRPLATPNTVGVVIGGGF